jgi:N-sulfoglucosamine sulfohydrolase
MENRRSFLRQFTLGASALAMTRCASEPPPTAAKRPNILFCISDDQSYPHAGAYGTDYINTPNFDRVASEGVLFHNTFVSTPSCCPSRGSVLTGQDFYRLREASMNHTVWPSSDGLPVYTDILGDAGYHVGYTGKGWGPGNWQVSGRETSPTGPAYNDIQLEPPGKFVSPIDYASNFQAFLDKRPDDAPFVFWSGFIEPHRELDDGIGVANGKRLADMQVPGFYPDSPEIRGDIADYAFEIEYYDQHLGRMLKMLEAAGELDNTLVVVTSDNGMAFPRAKATVYDYGARMPLAIRWGDKVQGGRTVRDFVSFTDFAPTFLEAAGVSKPPEMTGQSLMEILESSASGQIDPTRDHAVFGIERHFPGSRPDGLGYPMRGIRTADHLYIRNLMPELNPVGDHPGPVWPDDDPTGGYGDTDGSPTKSYLWDHRNDQPEAFARAFGKRPAEELFAVNDDPYNLKNLANNAAMADTKAALAARLDQHLKTTGDPRATGNAAILDDIMKRYPVLGSNDPTLDQSR